MSVRRGRPLTRSRGQTIPISAIAPASASGTSGKSSQDLRQEVTELRGTLAGILRALDILVANQLRQVQVQQRTKINDDQVAGPAAQGTNGNVGGQLLKNFMALQPPEFYGAPDVSVAENWMLAIEKYFRTMGCNDVQKVQLGTFLLRGDAERWWEIARQRYVGREPLWAEFLEAFNETYCPEWVREQKIYEFIELAQGDKSVAEYEAEFISLAQYAPDLVSIEAKKAAKFQRGLRVDIRHAFAGARIMDYSTVVQRAYAIERDRNELRMNQAPLKEVHTFQGPNNKKKRQWEGGPGRNTAGISSCAICGKKHSGLCRFDRGVCYHCGEVGHIRKDCPQNLDVLHISEVTCFKCGRKGHKANNCTQPSQHGRQRPRRQGQRINQRSLVRRMQGMTPQSALPSTRYPITTD